MHIEIPADDTKRSQEFWGSLFGWQFQANPGPFEYHTTQIGGEQGAAITNMEPGKRGTRPYFAGDGIKGGAARVTGLGGGGNNPPTPSRHRRGSTLHSPPREQVCGPACTPP